MQLQLSIERTRSQLGRRSLALACIVVVAASCATNGQAGAAPPTANGRDSLAADAGLGVGAVLATAVYAPVKLAYALGGSLVGGLAWIFSGGDSIGARGVIEPALYGDYVITPDHLRDPRSIEFIGSSSADYTYAGSSSRTGALPAVSAAPPGLRADGTIDCAVVSTLPAVHFEFERSQVNVSAAAALDLVASVLQSCPALSLDIQAHTDATGSQEFNARLSEARATSVRDYLVGQGVPGDRLATKGFGSSQPVASNASEYGRAQNRRAELPIR